MQQQAASRQITILGGDEAGLMYGLLELAERKRLHGAGATLDGVSGKPFIARRGIKFNIPLDARTPSYDDSGDAAQRNIGEMWRMEFWIEFFDQMARDRYNMISFWNPHPFPSMVRSESFPDVALDDVCVTTLVPNGRENEWGEPQLVSSNVLANLKIVKRLSIEEKIAFWQAVLQQAADRGIDVYFITWNICPNSVAQGCSPITALTTTSSPPTSRPANTASPTRSTTRRPPAICATRKETPKGTTPLEVAAQLDALAESSIAGTSRLNGSNNPDLSATLDDLRGMAWLGRYYAGKIRAAVALTLFRENGDKSHHDEAVREIRDAYEACTQYADHAQARYHSQMLARTGLLDWSAMLNDARKDMAIVRQAGVKTPSKK